MIFKKINTVGALITAMTLFATAALAGPVFTFGPEDQGQLKLDYKGQFQLVNRDTGGEADASGNVSEFNFRRNRIALMGAYGPNFGLYVQTEFSEDNNIAPLGVSDGDNSNFQILDAVMRFKASDAVNVWVGKFKYSFTRENLEACEAPLTLDRSLLIRAPYVGTRDKGVSIWGNLFNDRFQYRADVMNGRSDALSAPKSSFRYTARAHVSLLDAESGYGYKGTYLGDKTVLTVGGAYQYEAEVAYDNVAAATGAKDYKAWTADLFFEYPDFDLGTFTVSAAYVDYDLDEAYKGADPDAGAIGLNGEKNGAYYKIGYMLPDTPLQIFARYENWALAELNNIIDQEIDWIGGGVNYYFRGQDLKVTVEYSQTQFDKEGTFGGVKTENFGTLTAQLQLVF